METKTNLSLATSQQKSSALPEHWIERLFARFSAAYGASFADMWKGCDLKEVKAVWAEYLGRFSREELAAGLERCLAEKEWPPKLPEFMKLCRPPVDFQSALIEAVEQMGRRESGGDRWSHPAIYWAAVRIGAYDLSRRTLRDLEPEWKTALADEMARGKWPEIPERRPALPAPGQTHSKAVGRETVAQMLSRLRGDVDAESRESAEP